MSGGFLALQQKKSKERKKIADLEDAFRLADTNKDGKISVDSWLEILKATGHQITRGDVIDIFREKDVDVSVGMSFEEYSGFDSRNELAFKAIDKNGDGFVSFGEFTKICPNLNKEQVESAFRKFDADGTGRINYKEFCTMMRKYQDKASASSNASSPTTEKPEED
ncbi:CALM [Lepeophtheirus salmonis]|uniref:CALM n=2 Tax=Lepeophtheirus salmonis TaxID=72036 RepID=D3PJ71_LEPSM|nr:Calmodulin [Lepeophtheirus salmonis]CAB4061888.1 CALM [Lepeophtheirus salmonis]CAF2892692.1 CALM [Lepeophtheirus salmonis]